MSDAAPLKPEDDKELQRATRDLQVAIRLTRKRRHRLERLLQLREPQIGPGGYQTH